MSSYNPGADSCTLTQGLLICGITLAPCSLPWCFFSLSLAKANLVHGVVRLDTGDLRMR